MDDERVVRRTPFGGKDRKDRVPVQCVCAKTVDSFRRESYKLSAIQQIRCEGIGFRVRIKDFCLHGFQQEGSEHFEPFVPPSVIEQPVSPFFRQDEEHQ